MCSCNCPAVCLGVMQYAHRSFSIWKLTHHQAHYQFRLFSLHQVQRTSYGIMDIIDFSCLCAAAAADDDDDNGADWSQGNRSQLSLLYGTTRGIGTRPFGTAMHHSPCHHSYLRRMRMKSWITLREMIMMLRVECKQMGLCEVSKGSSE